MHMKKEFFFYVYVPSIYGNKRKDGSLSRHRIGVIKAANIDNKVIVTGSLISNKKDIFLREKGFKLIEERIKNKKNLLEIKDPTQEVDIRDIIKECKLTTKEQDVNLLMSPLNKIKSIKDLIGREVVKDIQSSESRCLDHNNYELNRIIKLAAATIDVSNN